MVYKAEDTKLRRFVATSQDLSAGMFALPPVDRLTHTEFRTLTIRQPGVTLACGLVISAPSARLAERMSSRFQPPPRRKTIRAAILLKAVLHNIGVVVVGFCFAFLGRVVDSLLGIAGFDSVFTTAIALLLLVTGFLLRLWATCLFYEQHMKVISLVPQKRLITSGPYRLSRNPLYLGGNVFIFLGAVLFVGSPSGIALTAANILVVDMMIRREEKQLAQEFGESWVQYTKTVRRWL